MKLLFDNSDQHVSGDGAPDLRLHRVLAVADETFDAQMLLDPLEEQFDLPAAFVERGDSQCGQGGIVGQEHQRLAGLRIFETDAPQLLGIILRDVVSIQDDALIADDACASVCRTRIHPVRIHASLGSSHEECSSLMQREQTTEVQVAAIHYVERSGRQRQYRIGDAKSINFDQARDAAIKLRGQIILGIDPTADKAILRAIPTFVNFMAERYMPFVKGYKRSWKSDDSYLRNHLLPAFGKKYLDEIAVIFYIYH